MTEPRETNIAYEMLSNFIERIEALKEEKKSLSDDITEIFKEAKDSGFEPRIMREIIKLRAMDTQDLDEYEVMLELYKVAVKLRRETD